MYENPDHRTPYFMDFFCKQWIVLFLKTDASYILMNFVRYLYFNIQNGKNQIDINVYSIGSR